MFHITLSPQCRDRRAPVVTRGDTLIIDNIEYDFSPLPEGAVLPASATGCDLLVGEITRIDGTIHVHMLLAHNSNAPRETCWPEPVLVEDDGEVPLPPFGSADAEEPEQPEAEDDGQGELPL